MPAFDSEHKICWVTWACTDVRNQKKYFDKAEDAQDKHDGETKKKKRDKSDDDDAAEKTKKPKKSRESEPDAEHKSGKRPRKQK